jgi:hypothetical protein
LLDHRVLADDATLKGVLAQHRRSHVSIDVVGDLKQNQLVSCWIVVIV